MKQRSIKNFKGFLKKKFPLYLKFLKFIGVSFYATKKLKLKNRKPALYNLVVFSWSLSYLFVIPALQIYMKVMVRILTLNIQQFTVI